MSNRARGASEIVKASSDGVAASLSELRRAACAQSLRAFLQTYLPSYCTIAFSRMHLELFAALETATTNRGARLAIAAPRGHAKSTIVSMAYLLWVVCYERDSYILLVSDTADQAATLLNSVKHELESNPRLRQDFPKACHVPPLAVKATRWRRNEIVTGNGIKITALGVDSKARGRRHHESRPTLIVLDDLENEAGVRSPDQRKQLEEWLAGAVLNAGTGTTNIVVVGTILHYDSLLAKLTDPRKKPGWTGSVYRAIESFASNADLWERFEGIYNGLETDENARHGRDAARGFFTAHKDAMLAGSAVLWPEREDYSALIEMRIRDGRASFSAEKLNAPLSPEDATFREEDFQYWDDQYDGELELLNALGDNAQFFGACDPSLGKAGRSRDDTAIITLVRDGKSGVLYVLDADIRKRKPDQIIDAVIEYGKRRCYQSFGVEVVQFQEFLATELSRRSRIVSREVPVKPIKHTTDKLGRIQRLQPLVTSGGIRFSRKQTMLVEQLMQHPYAAHDDGPDALEMAVETVQVPELYASVSFTPAVSMRRVWQSSTLDGVWHKPSRIPLGGW
jgi:predicted phage terminase large subunit-like protein